MTWLLLLLGWAAGPTFEESMRLGRDALAAGRFEEAITRYEAARTAMPGHAGALLNLCIATHSAGHYEKALAWCGKSQVAPGRLFEGLSLLKLKRTREAIVPLEKFLSAEPKQALARFELANAYLILGNGAKALANFSVLRDLDPRNPRAWQGIGMSELRLSEEIFEQEKPGSAAWHALAGLALLDQGQDRRAYAHLRKALAIEPGLAGVHTGIAEIYRRAQRPEWADAERAKERGSAANSAYTEALAHSQAALEAFEQLARLPESAELFEVRGAAERARRRYPESAAWYARAWERRRGDGRVESEYARALYLARDYENALPLLEKNGLAYEAGAAWLELGEAAKAVAVLETVTAREPKRGEARAKLGEAYLASGDAAKALPHLQAAAGTDRDGRIHLLLARAYQRSGVAEKAQAAQARYRELRALSGEGEEEGEIGPP